MKIAIEWLLSLVFNVGWKPNSSASVDSNQSVQSGSTKVLAIDVQCNGVPFPARERETKKVECGERENKGGERGKVRRRMAEVGVGGIWGLGWEGWRVEAEDADERERGG